MQANPAHCARQRFGDGSVCLCESSFTNEMRRRIASGLGREHRPLASPQTRKGPCRSDRTLFLQNGVLPRHLPHAVETLHVNRAESLRSFFDFKFYLLTIPEVFARDFAVMNKYVFASVVALDKAVAFFATEPLNCSVLHIGVLVDTQPAVDERRATLGTRQ